MATAPAAGATTGSATALPPRRPPPCAPGRGRLFPPLESSPGDLLALPDGFSYEIVAVSGETDLQDGTGKLSARPPNAPTARSPSGWPRGSG